MRNSIGPALGRVFGVIAGLMLLGIMLRLVTALLTPVLPAPLMQMLTEGWQLLFSLVGGAWAPIAAVLIICALCWAVLGRRY
jgi:hypothetical protein